MGNENANQASESQAPAMVLKDSSVAPLFPSFCPNAASGDPCRSTGFYRSDRAWAPENKPRIFQLFLFPPRPSPGLPIGRAPGLSGALRFIGICRKCSHLTILVKSGSPLGHPRWSGVHLPLALQSCQVPLWARKLKSEPLGDQLVRLKADI